MSTKPRSSNAFSSTMRTDGEPSAVARAIASGAGTPASRAAANHAVNSASGSSRRSSRSRAGRAGRSSGGLSRSSLYARAWPARRGGWTRKRGGSAGGARATRFARTSHALLADGGVWLVDPIQAPGVAERVVALGEPRGVIQLLDRHARDCAAWSDGLGVPLHVVPFEPVGPVRGSSRSRAGGTGANRRSGGRRSASSSPPTRSARCRTSRPATSRSACTRCCV